MQLEVATVWGPGLLHLYHSQAASQVPEDLRCRYDVCMEMSLRHRMCWTVSSPVVQKQSLGLLGDSMRHRLPPLEMLYSHAIDVVSLCYRELTLLCLADVLAVVH